MDAVTRKNVIRPLADRLLVRVGPAGGGLCLPDVHQKRPGRGEVVSAGAGVEAVEAGDVVLFTGYDAGEVGGDRDLVLVRESDVGAVIEDQKEEKPAAARPAAKK